MMSDFNTYDTYVTPFSTRYTSKEMQYVFSQRNRFSTWRQLWIWLAEAQKELGIEGISDEAIAQMKSRKDIRDEEFKVAEVEEKRRRHDVMAHVHTFGQAAPLASGIIHLGATSCYLTDCADQIFLRDGLQMLITKLARGIKQLAIFSMKHKDRTLDRLTEVIECLLISCSPVPWVHSLSVRTTCYGRKARYLVDK